MAKELDKQYSPQNVEDRTYKFWCDHKYFHAEVNPDKKPYTIVIPRRTLPASCTWVMRWTRLCRIFSSAGAVWRVTRPCGCRARTTRPLQRRPRS